MSINTTKTPTCTGCSQPAEFCQECTEHSRSVPTCTHELTHPSYCRYCAAIYPDVADCVNVDDREDERGYRGLDFPDYDIWATDSADGASAEELAVMDHWRHDWTSPDGTAYPVPAWRD